MWVGWRLPWDRYGSPITGGFLPDGRSAPLRQQHSADMRFIRCCVIGQSAERYDNSALPAPKQLQLLRCQEWVNFDSTFLHIEASPRAKTIEQNATDEQLQHKSGQWQEVEATPLAPGRDCHLCRRFPSGLS